MGLIMKLFNPGFSDTLLSSQYPFILKLIRVTSALFFTAVMIYYLIHYGFYILKYFTFEVFLLNTICFDLTLLSYYFIRFRPLAYVLHELILPFNCIVTLIYWAYLSPYAYSKSQIMGLIVPHTVPILMNFIDLTLNEIKFDRKHYLVSYVYSLIYTFCVMLPITLTDGVLYKGVTFKNWFTAVFIIVLFALVGLFLEIARVIKIKCTCLVQKTQVYSEVV